MTYFVIDKENIQHVYRHTFKQDPNSTKLAMYLKKEKTWHESKRVKINEHKYQNHHLINFLKDCLKAFFLQ